MPASAHFDSASPDHGPAEQGGRVINFADRTRRKGAPAVSAPQEAVVELGAQERAVAQAWQNAMAREGVSLEDPNVAAALRAGAAFLERLVHGARAIREGDPASGQPANPNDGMDPVSAELMLNLLGDMRRVPEHAAALRPGVREL